MQKLLTLLLIIILAGCSSAKMNPLESKKDSIVFGSGGGFSGIENSTMILENGAIFELQNMRTKYQLKKKINKQDVQQLFSTFTLLGLDDMELNSPGNSYNYIEFHIQGDTKRLVWNSNAAPTEIQILNRILYKLAQ